MGITKEITVSRVNIDQAISKYERCKEQRIDKLTAFCANKIPYLVAVQTDPIVMLKHFGPENLDLNV